MGNFTSQLIDNFYTYKEDICVLDYYFKPISAHNISYDVTWCIYRYILPQVHIVLTK